MIGKRWKESENPLELKGFSLSKEQFNRFENKLPNPQKK